MRFLNDRRIGTRLLMLLAVPVIALMVVAAFAAVNLNAIKDKLITSLYDEAYVSSSYLLNADRDLYQSLVSFRAFFNAEDTEEQEDALKDYQENLAQVEERAGKAADIFEAKHSFYAEIRNDESGKNAFEHLLLFRTDLNEWKTKTEEMIKGYQSAAEEDKMSWQERADSADSFFDSARNHLDLLQGINDNGALIDIDDADRTGTRLLVGLSAAVLLSLVIAAAFSWLLIRSVTRPVNTLAAAAHQVADGNLDADIRIDTKDEIGLLASAFRRMTSNLNEVMGNIQSASEQVAAGAKQVSESSMALSQGATEQASSVEQLTASLEEISSQTKLNADNAIEANHLAEEAKDNAVQGNERMKEMLKAMDDINDASGNISKIIKVIDEIAFQTNILALNAAVEAARAGQHGKGFAVVAEEVRNLAARSAGAAKETTDLIEGTIKKVDGGTKIAGDTAAALNKIVDGVAKVANLVSDIAVASNEQATGVAQINQGILQVSRVVQANSATSEESASASEELSGQAAMMQEQVGKFKLKRTARASSYAGLEELSTDVIRMLERREEIR
ncbi:methyl-accepting chemotaxis protein [Cohnella suwonensis]|uniref:Methyl-accepting chemotaxis protein n=1 Tax=Cohnella suwonensis TaxID=696072 RepID=A0ABW0M2F3_9BACL